MPETRADTSTRLMRRCTDRAAPPAGSAPPLAAPTGPLPHEGALHAYASYMSVLGLHSGVPAARGGRAEAADRPGTPTPVGWCSWYCHGPNVSEELMLGTIQRLGDFKSGGSLPIELVQLDDGWQSQWGDWTTPHSSRFPNGLKPITEAARAHGLMVGLWIAPCALTSSSKLIHEHPEWILRTASGAPLKCGWTAPGSATRA